MTIGGLILPDQRDEGRLVDIIAALAVATDLGMGQPMEQAFRTCLLSMYAGRRLGLTNASLHDTYYLALLRFIGCTADAHEAAAAVGGDELKQRSDVASVLMGGKPGFIKYMLAHYAEDQPLIPRLRFVMHALSGGTNGPKRVIAEHCEVAEILSDRLGIGKHIGTYAGSVFERWDGKGLPGELAGDSIPVEARVVAVARDVEVFHRIGSWALTEEVLRARRQKAYDPDVADAFLGEGERWLAEITEAPTGALVMAAEPEPHLTVGANELDHVLRVFADFVDLKSPFTLGHSSQVAEYADAAARTLGLAADEARNVARAALVHDLGKIGVPNGIWDKQARLTSSEWERVRLHPYLTERVLSYSESLRFLAPIAGAHHERLDGSGYHRGSAGPSLGMAARILAAADAYQAMGQERPYRPKLDDETRARELASAATDGNLDRAAVQAVLSVAGQRAVWTGRPSWPAGLTDREVEVLRLISRGASKNQVAKELTISVKTAGRHVENLYAKIDVSSRAAAALFAMENGLLLP